MKYQVMPEVRVDPATGAQVTVDSLGYHVAFVYWDNPYFSGFSGNRTGIERDVFRYAPVITKSGGVQVNQSLDNRPPALSLNKNSRSNSADEPGHDFEEWVLTAPVAGLPFGVPILMGGFAGIVDHPVFNLELRLRESPNEPVPLPQFEPYSTTTTLAPRDDVTEDFWLDRWQATSNGKRIHVEITRGSTGLTASVEETVTEPIKFRESGLASAMALAESREADRWHPVLRNDSVAMPRGARPDDTRPLVVGGGSRAERERELVALAQERDVSRRPSRARWVHRLTISDMCFVEAYADYHDGQR